MSTEASATPAEDSATPADQLAAILRAATEYAIIGTDPLGVITFFNEGAERMLGYRAEEVVGKLTPRALHDPAEIGERAAELGIPPGFEVFVAASRRGVAETREWTYIRKDESRLLVSLSVTALHDRGGTLTGFMGIAHDVTARHRAELERQQLLTREQETRATAERLAAERSTMLRQIADGVITANQHGRITFANEAARKLLGVTALKPGTDEITNGYQILRISGEPYAKEDWPLARAALSGAATVEEEWRILRPDGSAIVVEGSAAPLTTDDGECWGAVLTFRDVTARYELERHKDDFLATISHDLRTPLTAIKASIGVVLANEPPGMPEPLHRMLLNIEQGADRMGRLVADLLELARIRAGRARPQLSLCDLHELVRRTAEHVEPLLETRGQRLTVDLPAEPISVMVDRERLERALGHLLDNAHKFGRAGGTIHLRLCHHADEVVFAVVDDGPGIPEVELERIFDRFYRAEPENGHLYQGSGLGLPLVRAAAELHGGEVRVDSTPETGTTFRLTLPTNASVTTRE